MTSQHDRHEFDTDDALRAVLAAADPARSLPPAHPEALAAVLADVVRTDAQPGRSGRPVAQRRTRASWLVAAAAVVAIAGIGGYAVTAGGDDAPATPSAGAGTRSEGTDLTSPTPEDSGLPVPGTTVLTTEVIQGRCAAASAANIKAQQQAFAATVTAIADGVVTMRTSEVFTGDVAQTVQVKASPAALRELIQATRFKVGQSYLVSATGGAVAPCGLTGKATGDLQSMYEKAFSQ